MLNKKYSHLKSYEALAYMPGKKPDYQHKDKLKSIYPAGLEFVPPRFAICKRNEWMIDQADYVVTFVEIDSGGASKYKKIGRKKREDSY